MKIDNKYIIEVFIPYECTKYTEMGHTIIRICEKISDTAFKDLETNKIYTINNTIGQDKVFNYIPLSKYYYKIGFKKNNNHDNKEKVYKLVKTLKNEKIL